MSSEKKTSSRKKRIAGIICAVCVIGAAVCLILWGTGQYRNHEAQARESQESSQILEARAEDGGTAGTGSAADGITAGEASESSNTAASGSSDQTMYKEVAEAQAVNSDVLGTLEFGEDKLMYIVQAQNNDYYLTHTWDGKESSEGAAFLDARCSQNPRSTNWIIHGHNMRSGAIFGTLGDFRDLNFLKEHPLITVTLRNTKEYYVPYAILDLNVDPDGEGYFKITEFDFDTEQDFEDYTGYLIENSYYTLPVDVQSDDALLMLSTCSYGYSDGRLEICCRRLRPGETPESVSEQMQQAETSGAPIVD